MARLLAFKVPSSQILGTNLVGIELFLLTFSLHSKILRLASIIKKSQEMVKNQLGKIKYFRE